MGLFSGSSQNETSEASLPRTGPAAGPTITSHPGPVALAEPERERARSAKRARRPRARTVPRPANPTATTREVRVNIKGAKGSLTIEGQPKLLRVFRELRDYVARKLEETTLADIV